MSCTDPNCHDCDRKALKAAEDALAEANARAVVWQRLYEELATLVALDEPPDDKNPYWVALKAHEQKKREEAQARDTADALSRVPL